MASPAKTVVGVIVAIALIGLVAFAVMQVADNNENNEPTINEPTTQLDNLDNNQDKENLLSKVINEPAQYYDKEVTVAGEIQDAYSKRVFKVSDQTAGDELLVLTRRPLTQSQLNEAEELLEDNADVRVKGTVRQLMVTEIEREFGLDFPNDIEVEFRDKPILIADSFTFSDKNAVLDFTQGPSPQQ